MATLQATHPDITDPNKFEVLHDIPVFDEHEADEPEFDELGNSLGMRKVKYTAEILESICDNMNRRIDDTGDYVALCVGHTPTPAERKAGKDAPPAIGFAGPFYVGKIGNSDPRPAIIAENWSIFKDRASEAKQYPRRSIEMWYEPNIKDRYFEPIALLGSETPRRPLGLAYSKRHEGCAVARYSMGSVAACPSGTNTFVPGADEKRHDQVQEASAMLTDEDVQKLVAAVQETAEFQYIKAKMAEEAPKGTETEVPAAAPAVAEAPAAPVAPPEKAAYEGAEQPTETIEEKPKLREEEPAEPKDKEKYRMEHLEKARYAQLEGALKSTQAENASLRKRMEAVEGAARQKVRYAEVDLDAIEYVMDKPEEYGRADRYSDEAWQEHRAIMKNYSKIPLNGGRFLPVEAPSKPKLNEQAIHAEAKRRGVRYRAEGKTIPYDLIVAEVEAERGSAARNGAAV